MIKKALLLIVSGCLIVLQACAAEVVDPIKSLNEVRVHVQTQGLTCEAQEYLRDLQDGEREHFVAEFTEGMSDDDIHDLVDSREQECYSNSEEGDIGVVTQALWAGEVIERNDYGTNLTAPYLVARDDTGADICGDDEDWIGFYSKSGSYSNRSDLRIDATTSGAGCITGDQSARVYDTDISVVCFGYWTVFFCPGDESNIDDAMIWID